MPQQEVDVVTILRIGFEGGAIMLYATKPSNGQYTLYQKGVAMTLDENDDEVWVTHYNKYESWEAFADMLFSSRTWYMGHLLWVHPAFRQRIWDRITEWEQTLGDPVPRIWNRKREMWQAYCLPLEEQAKLDSQYRLRDHHLQEYSQILKITISD